MSERDRVRVIQRGNVREWIAGKHINSSLLGIVLPNIVFITRVYLLEKRINVFNIQGYSIFNTQG